jgi:F-type H+-transporting ATPase subunit b
VDINITLLGQMFTFGLFIFVTMKYIWPPMMKALEERRQHIASGLEAAERAKHDLKLAQDSIAAKMREAKHEVNSLIEEANRRGTKIVEEAKENGHKAGERMIELAKTEIANEYQRAKHDLVKHISTLSLDTVEKVLRKNMDKETNRQLINDLIAEI